MRSKVLNIRHGLLSHVRHQNFRKGKPSEQLEASHCARAVKFNFNTKITCYKEKFSGKGVLLLQLVAMHS